MVAPNQWFVLTFRHQFQLFLWNSCSAPWGTVFLAPSPGRALLLCSSLYQPLSPFVFSRTCTRHYGNCMSKVVPEEESEPPYPQQTPSSSSQSPLFQPALSQQSQTRGKGLRNTRTSCTNTGAGQGLGRGCHDEDAGTHSQAVTLSSGRVDTIFHGPVMFDWPFQLSLHNKEPRLLGLQLAYQFYIKQQAEENGMYLQQFRNI